MNLNVRIEILNPKVGEARYTSGPRALDFVKRGHAQFTEDGKLVFLDEASLLRIRHKRAEEAELSGRGGVVFWNGSADRTSRHRPGECRS